MTAIQQSGHPFKVFGIAAQFPPSVLTGSIGKFSNGKIFATTPQAVANSNPALVKITKAIKAQDSSAVLDDESLQAWGGMQVLKIASAHMTTFTPKALAAALVKTGTINLGYYAPFSFSKPLTSRDITECSISGSMERNSTMASSCPLQLRTRRSISGISLLPASRDPELTGNCC